MLLWAISAWGAPMMHYFPLVYSPLCLYSSAICAFPSLSSYLSTGNYAFTTYSLYSSPNLPSVVISFCRTLLFSPRLKGILVPALAKCQLKWNCWVSLCNITTSRDRTCVPRWLLSWTGERSKSYLYVKNWWRYKYYACATLQRNLQIAGTCSLLDWSCRYRATHEFSHEF